jgi:hypothetical protein
VFAAALGAAGNPADWAMATTDRANTVDIRNRANLLVMWLILNSLEICPGKSPRFLYQPCWLRLSTNPTVCCQRKMLGRSSQRLTPNLKRRGNHTVGCFVQGVDYPL